MWCFFLGNLCWKLNGILAVTVSRILHWWQWVLGQCLSDSNFHSCILHKFYQNGTHQLTQGGHRLFLFQGTKTKVWEEVLLQNSVQSLGDHQTWCKICNKGIMMVAGAKFPLNVMHMTGRTWMKTGRGCRVPFSNSLCPFGMMTAWFTPDMKNFDCPYSRIVQKQEWRRWRDVWCCRGTWGNSVTTESSVSICSALEVCSHHSGDEPHNPFPRTWIWGFAQWNPQSVQFFRWTKSLIFKNFHFTQLKYPGRRKSKYEL